MDRTNVSKIVRDMITVAHSPASIIFQMKMRQSVKIGELRQALVAAGLSRLDQQAAVLGLQRSTTWHVLKANHKSSGLSAKIIKRMLNSPQLPPPARRILLDYVDEKCGGAYGHDRVQVRLFCAQLGQIVKSEMGLPKRIGNKGVVEKFAAKTGADEVIVEDWNGKVSETYNALAKAAVNLAEVKEHAAKAAAEQIRRPGRC
jgi:hypothetical protein